MSSTTKPPYGWNVYGMEEDKPLLNREVILEKAREHKLTEIHIVPNEEGHTNKDCPCGPEVANNDPDRVPTFNHRYFN